jgi:hypothetical protein
MRFHALVLALAGTTACASFGAAAYNGNYVIEVLPNGNYDPPHPKCMVYDAARGAYGVRLDEGATCGAGFYGPQSAAKQATWTITPVKHTDGREALVLRNAANGQCLIRSNNGFDAMPRLHMWTSANPQWCGFGSANTLIENGQAAWVFGESPIESEELVSSMAVLRHGLGYLSFASNAGNVREGEAIVADTHVFRLKRVIEACSTSHALQPDIIRVCGVGDFAQPLRMDEAGYLTVPHQAWYAAPGRGHTSTAFVAVAGQDAEAYCRELRTGNFTDWRVPAPPHLNALYAAFPDNALYTKFGWSTGDHPHQTSLQQLGDFYGISLHNGAAHWYWAVPKYPVACVR